MCAVAGAEGWTTATWSLACFTDGALRGLMGMKAQDGTLVLADISGFTAFVTATELEHGPQIIGTLLEAVMRRLSPPLEIQEVEGDAVFALGPDGTLVPPRPAPQRPPLGLRGLQKGPAGAGV